MSESQTIIAKLREHEAVLRAAGVEHLVLHGSYARGTEIRELSDVDVLADFDRAKKVGARGKNTHCKLLILNRFGSANGNRTG
jgi:predicted nucleotidyltransferase